MSIETLRADLQANLTAIATLQPELATPAEIVTLLREVWAFIESHVDETAEQDECIADLVNGAEDILTAETAAVFSACATGGLVVATALKQRLNKAVPADAELYKIAEELETNCKAAQDIIPEIIIDGDDEDDVDDDDNEDDDADEQADTDEGDDQ